MDSFSHPASPASPHSHVEADGGPIRRPLGIIQNSFTAMNVCTCTNEIKRIAGPKESEYLLNYDSFVTSTIARYSARTQTNLHPNGTLPNYADMSPNQRISALQSVDVLLERLTNSNNGTDIHSIFGAGCEQHDDSVTTLGDEFSRLGNDETFGSATTTLSLGPNGEQYCGSDTHGSEATMGVSNRESIGAYSEGKTGCSLLLEESMNLLSDDGSFGTGDDDCAAALEDDESRFSEGEDQCCEMISSPKMKDSSRSTTASPIELARHTQDHPNSRSLHLAFEDQRSALDSSTTPPIFLQKHPSKRYASNSGNRGLKARHRSNHCRVDEELLGHFEGFSGDDSDTGMYQYFQDDESPIQRRFSNAGLESNCDFEMVVDDEIHDLADRQKVDETLYDFKNTKVETNEKKSSNFDNHDVNNIGGDYSDDDDQDNGRNSIIAAGSILYPQHSQWSSFRNANANLTSTQLEEETDTNNSPIRRGTLYVGESQRQQSLSIHQSHLLSHGEGYLKGDTDETDPIQTVRNPCRRAKCLEQQGLDSLQEVAPIDVRVRDGMNFRIDPLRCHNDRHRDNNSSDPSLSKRESFKDPISDFPSRVSARLNAGVDFLIDKERASLSKVVNDIESEREHPCAILLSMTIQQILCVTSKFLNRTSQSTRNHQLSKNTSAVNNLTPSFGLSSKNNDFLVGGTLIVLREKEDIEKWEVALREYTSLSVLNHHAAKQLNRKLGSFASKCAGFDVVLSTYDALKSNEVTVPVDSLGRAILDSHEQSNSNDGWLTSRASEASAKCLNLSTLLRLRWCRVIFLDVLGRKGYLAKRGTHRAKAAIALNSKSRFILFEHAGDNSNKAEKKFFDDRKQLSSFYSIMHLPEKTKLDTLIKTYILDVKKSGGSIEFRDSLSSDDTEQR